MKALALVLLLSIILGCNSNPPCNKVKPEEAKKILKSYFKAISDKEFDQLKALSTEDFIIYEQGYIWNNDSLIKAVKGHPEIKYEYNLKNFTIKPDCNSAFVYYFNDGTLTKNDSSYSKNWTESASVRRVNGTLKIEFIHSSVEK